MPSFAALETPTGNAAPIMKILDKISMIPDPWNRTFLLFWMGAAVIVTVVLGWNNGATTFWPAGLVLIALLMAVLLIIPRRRAQKPVVDNPHFIAETASEERTVHSRKSWIHPALAPLLLAAPFVLTALVIGNAGCGGFPAILVAMLSSVAIIMRNLENRLRTDSVEDNPSVKPYYFRTLSLVSTILFFFGVVTLWPWLGKLYGDRYFWTLVIGVLGPQLYFWGKIRQPHGEHPMIALIRFNRLLPYISVILLVAIILG